MTEPRVLGTREPGVAAGLELAMLGAAHAIDALVEVLGAVEAIEHDLAVRVGHRGTSSGMSSTSTRGRWSGRGLRPVGFVRAGSASCRAEAHPGHPPHEQVVEGPDQVEVHPPRPVLVMHHGDDVETVSPPTQRLDHDAEAGAQIPVLDIGQPVAVLLRLPHGEDERLLARLHRHLLRTQPPRHGDGALVEAKGPHQDDAGAEKKADPRRHEGAHAGEELAKARLPLDGLHVRVIRTPEHRRDRAQLLHASDSNALRSTARAPTAWRSSVPSAMPKTAL